MRILKLLNNKYFSIIFFLIFSSAAMADEKPVDIWNIDKKKIDEISSNDNTSKKKNEIKPGNSIYNTQPVKQVNKIQFDFYFNFDQQKINFDNVKIDNNYIDSLDRFIDNFNSKGKILNKIMLKNFINDLFDIYAG